MLVGWLVLLVSLLAGELLSYRLKLPVPGPVLGMALLALVLGVRRQAAARVERAANALLEHMPLLFVPAGVGAMQFWPQLKSAWLPIAVTLVIGTALTLAVTALTFKLCVALQARRGDIHER
jgi:holin-like protein